MCWCDDDWLLMSYPLNLVLVKVWDLGDNNPGQTSSKVEELMHAEAHDTCRKDIILHIRVPTLRDVISIYRGMMMHSKHLQPRGAQIC
jgi:hypothetical protein